MTDLEVEDGFAAPAGSAENQDALWKAMRLRETEKPWPVDPRAPSRDLSRVQFKTSRKLPPGTIFFERQPFFAMLSTDVIMILPKK